jgi:secreted PhoX family phosphatase
MHTRRKFLERGAITAGGAAATLGPGAALAKHRRRAGFGRPVEDPRGLLDLPRGFRYRVVQSVEDRLSNGAPVPGDFDGMVAIQGRGNSIVLVRNHELRPSDTATKAPVPGRNPYDPSAPAGTTGVVVGPDRRVKRSYVTSSGTLNNCAGGGTPWGTWITCEEDRTTGHGYAFEVDPSRPESNLSKTPIRDMGFFSHEAIGIDPRTGIAYLTEDDFRGNQVPPDEEVPGTTRSSFLYRYLPHNRRQRPGALQDGGRLQAMAISGRPQYNMDLGRTGERFRVIWVNVNPEDPPADALAKGAARFQRLEGCHFAGGAFWFDDTSGGERRYGQVFRLIPSGDPSGRGLDRLELFLEADRRSQMDAPDNLVVTPWGDIWLAEDGDDGNRVVGLTPSGRSYTFARNRLNDSELAGPTFSRSGRTFFVNIQNPGHTFAIWGPFPRRNAGGQREMGGAPPRHRWKPRVSGELREYAAKHDMSPYEAAAYDRLGVPVA